MRDRQSHVEPLVTDRLLLRPLVERDIDELVALDADPVVMRYITGGRATPRAEIETALPGWVDHRWIAMELATGAFLGWFSLRPTGEGERELGYRLRRDVWGQGFATEACTALIDHAFTSVGVGRIWAQTMTVNLASRRVMERCGLHYVRTFHQDWGEAIDGSDQGDVEYELHPPPPP